jgi:HlyD family secretion protein
MVSFATLHVVRAHQSGPEVHPPVDPARSPFASTVAGSGIVEARTENISIGSPLAGIVTKVYVDVENTVKAGDKLFELDDRALRAELKWREAAHQAALVQLERLDNQPRQEELDISRAKVKEAEVALADQKDQLTRARALLPRRAISDDEWERREYAHRLAEQQLTRVRAENVLLESGAWKWDKAVAKAAVDQAAAQVQQTKTELERLVVRAPVAGQVLQVNVRPGEFVGAPPGQPLIVLGDTQTRHVRVDIDENDIHRFRKEAKAWAKLRGAPDREYRLAFVRIEPYVVPKKSLTGESRERVDTRVLQVIYRMEPDAKVYVGQQLDVFIEGK